MARAGAIKGGDPAPNGDLCGEERASFATNSQMVAGALKGRGLCAAESVLADCFPRDSFLIRGWWGILGGVMRV